MNIIQPYWQPIAVPVESNFQPTQMPPYTQSNQPSKSPAYTAVLESDGEVDDAPFIIKATPADEEFQKPLFRKITNSNSVIVATKYDGRLHVGLCQDELSLPRKMGKNIVIYNNFITQFFSQILGLSMEVEIAGKVRCVNILSFKEHLQSINIECETKINIVSYESLIKNSKVELDEEYLGSDFSPARKEALTDKMLKCLLNHDVEGVKRQIRKGANYRQEFYYTNSDSSYRAKKDVFSKTLEGMDAAYGNFTRFTPLSFSKGNYSLHKFLLNILKGDLSQHRIEVYTPYRVTPWVLAPDWLADKHAQK